MAFGSMIVDVTTEMLAQIAYIALGLGNLERARPANLLRAGRSQRSSWSASCLPRSPACVFLALQRYGHRLTGKLAARLLPRAVAATVAVGDALDAIYRAPVRVAVSSALHLGGWIASAVGTWIAFRLIGAHVDLNAVMAIESLVYATRSAAFIVPNALGVQEAAYAVLAPLFGVGAEFGLAVSLLKRARDIAVGVPILAIWQAVEGRRALTAGVDGGVVD